MPRSRAAQVNRRATNITLPTDLLDQARELGLNISKACEQGIRVEIATRRAAQWLAENRDALVSSNEYVEQCGLPLSEFRRF